MFKHFRHSRTALVGVCCALVGAAVVPVLSLAGSISGSTGDGPMVLQSGQAASLAYEGRLNVSSAVATPEPATWSRVGDTVQQSGVIAVTPAAAGTNTQVYIPTVVDSNINGSGCSGNATVTAPSATTGRVLGTTISGHTHQCFVEYSTSSTTVQYVYYTMFYRVKD
jgi:hypothetical protein